MSGIVEEGYSISHEYNGNIVQKTLKTITIKEWVGQSYDNVQISDSTQGYSTVSVGGKSFSKARILSQTYEVQGAYGEHFRTTKIEQDITGSQSDCIAFCNISALRVDSFTDKTSTSESAVSKSETRSMSVQVTNDDALRSLPGSPSASSVLDAALACMQKEMDAVVASCGEQYTIQRSETIDNASCSASMSFTKTEDLRDCAEDCIMSESTSISYDEMGMVNINISGNIKGAKDEYNCDNNGNKISIKKTKFQFAEDCYASINARQKVLGQYEAHKQEPCEQDVCLALILNSESNSKCKDQGTISWSISATEQESLNDSSGMQVKTRDAEQKNGCITDITRSFEFKTTLGDPTKPYQVPIFLSGSCPPVNPSNNQGLLDNLMSGFDGLDTSPPASFFGPLSFNASISLSSGSISGSLTFSNDKEYENVSQNIIRKKITKTEVCQQEKVNKEKSIPCGGMLKYNTTGSPGYTKECVEVEAYPCAQISDIINALNMQLGSADVILEDTISIGVNEGSKTGSACLKYHTQQDLKGNC